MLFTLQGQMIYMWMNKTRLCVLILGWWKIDENKAHEKRVAGLIAAICQQSLHALNNGKKQ